MEIEHFGSLPNQISQNLYYLLGIGIVFRKILYAKEMWYFWKDQLIH